MRAVVAQRREVHDLVGEFPRYVFAGQPILVFAALVKVVLGNFDLN
jgi:hypothetical protein